MRHVNKLIYTFNISLNRQVWGGWDCDNGPDLSNF